MPIFTQSLEKYLEQCLADFGLLEASAEEQQKTLVLVSERLGETVVAVAVTLMTKEQWERFSGALHAEPADEDEITRISAEVTGLQQAIEEAIVIEYQSLKEAVRNGGGA